MQSGCLPFVAILVALRWVAEYSLMLMLCRVFSFEAMPRHEDGHENIVKEVLQFLVRAGIIKRV